jgi:hypothetical protein
MIRRILTVAGRALTVAVLAAGMLAAGVAAPPVPAWAAAGRATAGPGPGFAVTALRAARSPAGRPVVLVRLRGTGSVLLTVTGRAQLSGGPGGSQTPPVSARRPVALAPGQRAAMTFLLGAGLPAGPWHARIWLTGRQGAAMAQATIRFPAGASGSVLRRYRKPVAVWLATVALALCVIAGVTVARLRQRPRPRQAAA